MMIVPEILTPGEIVTQEEIASFWETQTSFLKHFDNEAVIKIVEDIDRLMMPSLIFTSAPMPQLGASEILVNVSWATGEMRLVLETHAEEENFGETFIYAINGAQDNEDGFVFFHEFDKVSDVDEKALEDAKEFLIMMSRTINHRLKVV